ncbi:MAG: hypothetical protein K8Q89_05565 [Nitrosarchaeum sp.]|nr:hypothetical protein [Nitrosarchaeum sp.]
MYKWIFLLALIGIPLAFLSIYNVPGNGIHSDPNVEKSSILDMGQDFINQVAHEKSTEEHTLGMFKDITDEDVLKEKETPDLVASEKIQNNGIRLSTNYNQISLDYSGGKLTTDEYLEKLLDFKIKYEKYMTSMDSYIGSDDITIQRNSMIQELKDINQQILVLKSTKNAEDGWQLKSEYDQYRKLLPSMFNP